MYGSLQALLSLSPRDWLRERKQPGYSYIVKVQTGSASVYFDEAESWLSWWLNIVNFTLEKTL